MRIQANVYGLLLCGLDLHQTPMNHITTVPLLGGSSE